MTEVIQFNLDRFEDELRFFGQEWFELAEAEIFSEQKYLEALQTGPMLAGAQGIDAVLAQGIDVIVAPTNSPAWPNDVITGDSFQFGTSSYAAVAGYPLITVPAGHVFGLPLGLTFMASQWQEPMLLRAASGFEAARQARTVPSFKATLIDDRQTPFFKRNFGRPLPPSKAQLGRLAKRILQPSLRKPFYI